MNFARFGGINVFKVILISQVIGGFIAAIGGMTEVMGVHRRFNWQLSPGYGWDGVVVAIIGRNNPLLIILSSLFLAYLRVGGRILNLLSDIPSEMITVIQSIIILLITAEAFLAQWKYKITVREAKAKEVSSEPHT
jgi:simple sugar transport system permease protein